MKNKKAKIVYSIKDEYNVYLTTVEDVEAKNYIEGRILGQISWYDKKSISYQKFYKRFSITSMALSSIIPVIVLLNSDTIFIKILIALFSSGITLITGVLSLNKYKELWLKYRNQCETLKSLLHKYFTKSDIFSKSDDLSNKNLLIDVTEYIITCEIDNWLNMNIKEKHEKN